MFAVRWTGRRLASRLPWNSCQPNILGNSSNVGFSIRSHSTASLDSNCDSNSNSSTGPRLSSENLSLEVALLQYPEIVKSHLKSRQADTGSGGVHVVDQIIALRESRNSLMNKSNNLRNQRKTLSQDIGKIIKDKSRAAEVEALKASVEKISLEFAELDRQQLEIENKMKALQQNIPNLLDDR